MKLKVFFAETLEGADIRPLYDDPDDCIVAVSAVDGGMNLICDTAIIASEVRSKLHGRVNSYYWGFRVLRVAVEMREDRGVSNLLELLLCAGFDVTTPNGIPSW